MPANAMIAMRCQPMKWLTPEQKTRIQSAEFYELLQREVTRRFLYAGQKGEET